MGGLLSSAGGVVIALAAFAVLLPLIVFVHEYGHFKVARLCGVRVDAFSIGFGPQFLGWDDRHGTRWKISAIPLGGYVKFFGDANAASAGASGDGMMLGSDLAPTEAEPPQKTGEKNGPGSTQFGSERARLEAVLTPEEKAVCFHFKPIWQRMAVVAAGPFANFALAVAIFAVLFGTLGRPVVDPVVGQVVEGSAAEEAGFEVGDRVVSLAGRPVADWAQMANRIRLSSGTALDFEVERAGNRVTLRATPRRTESEDAFGNAVSFGRLGIASANVGARERFGPFGAVREACAEVGNILEMTVRMIGRLVAGNEDPRQLGGPIKIAQYAGQAASSGFVAEGDIPFSRRVLASVTTFATLAALISVSIGFLNLLPVPVLDGGHLVFYAYEAIAGQPLPERVQGAGFTIGLAMIACLMIFVVVNDVVGMFGI